MLPPKTDEDVQDLVRRMESYYKTMFKSFEEDDNFYEGNIEELITVPEGFDITIPTTARAIVDEAVDNIEPYDLMINYSPRGLGQQPQQDAEKIVRFLKSMWDYWRRTNSDIDVLRDFIKNMFKNGKAVFKVVPDWTLWPGLEEDEEPDEDQLKMIKKIREEHFPITLRSIDPRHIMEDPTLDSRKLWVIERYDSDIEEVRNRYIDLLPELADSWNELNYEIHEVWTASYVDQHGKFHQGKHWTLVNQEVHGEVEDNIYHEVPYIIKYSGLGRETFDGKPEYKATGFFTRQVKSMLRAETRRITHFDAIMSQLAFPIAFLPEAAGDFNIVFEPGTINYVPEEVMDNIDKVFLSVQIPAPEYQQSISMIQSQIERSTTQRAIRGAGVPGTDSAAQLQMITAQAKLRLEPIKRATEEAVDATNYKVLDFIENIFEDSVSVFGAENDAPARFTLKPSVIRGRYTTKSTFMPSQEQVKERRLVLLGEAKAKGINIYDALVFAGFDNPMEIIERDLAYSIMEEPSIKRQLAKAAALKWDLDIKEMEIQEAADGAEVKMAIQEIMGQIQQQTGVAPGEQPMGAMGQGGQQAPAGATPQAAGAPIDQGLQPPPNVNDIIRTASGAGNG